MERKKRERRGFAENRRGKAGETLTETLVTMLIVGLSSVLFLTMVGAAGRIFRKSKTDYDRLYEKITAADNKNATSSDSSPGDIGKIIVTGTGAAEVEVDWYGSRDYVLSYKAG